LILPFARAINGLNRNIRAVQVFDIHNARYENRI
jgi:hypothetical protein